MSVHYFPTFHSFPLGLALTCFSRAWGHTKRGFLDRSLELQLLLAKLPPTPPSCSPGTVSREAGHRAPGSGIITSFPPTSHSPNSLVSSDANHLTNDSKQTSDGQPQGGPPLPEFRIQAYSMSPQQCSPQGICKSLFLHGPEIPFPHFNEAWICSPKGLEPAIEWPNPEAQLLFLPLSHPFYMYISKGCVRTATREF